MRIEVETDDGVMVITARLIRIHRGGEISNRDGKLTCVNVQLDPDDQPRGKATVHKPKHRTSTHKA